MNCRNDIKEIIAFMLKNELENKGDKVNLSRLAREHGCDRRTIKKYLVANQSPPVNKIIKTKSKLDEFKNLILNKFECGVPATGIYMILKKNYKYNGSYSLITKMLRSENKKRAHKAIFRFETNPGLQAQVDWKESLKFHTKSGEIIEFNIFIITLGFSRKRYIEVTETRDQVTVFKCLANSFLYFEGVPKEILFDNMRSITDKSRTAYNKVVYNDKFVEFAKELGFKAMNCVAYRPCTKGKVESVARLLNRFKAYDNEINSFNDIVRLAKEFNEEINNEIHQGIKRRPNDLFKKEKEYLLSLGDYYQDRLRNYLEPEIKRLVSKESLYSYKGHKYSVDPKYIGKHIYIINENEESFDITVEDGHFIKNQLLSEKAINYSKEDYKEIAKNSSISGWDEKDIDNKTEESLKVYDKLQ